LDFVERLGDPALGFVAEPPGTSEVTLVAFGGIRGGLGIPPYEFFRVTEGLPVRRVFVRDLDQVWYLRGVRGLGDTLPEAAAALGEALGAPVRLVTTGNSAGGFAAIAFGSLLGADETHAFAPQTAIDRRHRVRWMDVRWPREMHHLRRVRAAPELLDLRTVLRDHPGSAIHVHHSAAHGWDRRHAEHLRDLPDVTLHAYPAGGHRLVAELRDDGRLDAILSRAIARRDE
jgi:hypothetical protein